MQTHSTELLFTIIEIIEKKLLKMTMHVLESYG